MKALCLVLKPVLVLTAALVFCGSQCEDPYKTNPDFVLLLGQDGLYPSAPAPSPNGELLYYLVDTTYLGTSPPTGGELRVRTLQDSIDRLLVSGHYQDLALSGDGRTIALGAIRSEGDTSYLLLLDSSGLNMDTVQVSSSPDCSITDFELSLTGDRLFYLCHHDTGTGTYVYSIDLAHRTGPELIRYLRWLQYGFDLYDGDSIYADSLAGSYPSVNPVHTRWVIFAGGDRFGAHWKLQDRVAGTTEPWGSETKPYIRCDHLSGPAWTADGRDLLFVVARKTGDGYARTEVWMLRNAIRLLPGQR